MRYSPLSVPPYTAYFFDTFLTLTAVCVLAGVVLWGARRFGPARTQGPITLCGTLQLDARRAVHLVRVGEQVFVLAASEAGLTKLGELPASGLDFASPGARGPAFRDILALARPRGER